MAVGQDQGKRMAEQECEATVLELMPNAICRLELVGGGVVLAHAAGAGVANFVRLRPGDTVSVLVSATDRTRARITKVLSRK